MGHGQHNHPPPCQQATRDSQRLPLSGPRLNSGSRLSETGRLAPTWSGQIVVVTPALENIQTLTLTIQGGKGN